MMEFVAQHGIWVAMTILGFWVWSLKAGVRDHAKRETN